MIDTLQNSLMADGLISGTYRLREPMYCETKDGRMYVRFRLEDMSADVDAFSWNDKFMSSPLMRDLSSVYIEGRVRSRLTKQVVDIGHLMPARVGGGEAVRLIPRSLCPHPWLLSYLAAAVGLLTIAPLQRFVHAVLGDDGIAFAFVNAPASLHHHHNYPGGLLKHSLESFSIVEKHRSFPREKYELGLVAALFHDLGKILTMTSDMKRTTLGSSNEHEKLTLEILAPFFKQLEQTWADGARELRYLLGWKVKRPVPHYNIADLVACSDRLSAGLDMDRRRS